MSIDFSETGALELSPESLHDLRPEDLFEKLLVKAGALNATDLFFLSKQNFVEVSIRRMGELEKLIALPKDQANSTANYVRTQCGMDLSKKRGPLDGRWVAETEDRVFDLRVNSVGTLWGEDLAIRLMPEKSHSLSIGDVGFVGNQINMVKQMLSSDSGLVLMTGPTGSGKTTTLYAMLNHVNDGRRKINTLEDPIEYAVEDYCQSQVNERAELTFSNLLRGIIRQSPDVIMIGEIRDEETAQIAVRAANSGHLVLTTVHAPTSASAVQSLVSLGVNRAVLASSLLGIVSQRLIRALSPDSKIRFDAPEAADAFESVAKYLEGEEGLSLFGPDKSDQNSRDGYSHQIGLFEVMSISNGIRDAIRSGESPQRLLEIAQSEGMLSFQQAGLLNVAKGHTSLEEIMHSLPALS